MGRGLISTSLWPGFMNIAEFDSLRIQGDDDVALVTAPQSRRLDSNDNNA